MAQNLICIDEWGSLFTDDQLAADIIDRIVHYGHLINIEKKQLMKITTKTSDFCKFMIGDIVVGILGKFSGI